MGKRSRREAIAETAAPVLRSPWWPPIEAFLERRATLLTIALIALATVRIVSTYGVFSHTFDEPAHIACGMQWIEQGAYKYEVQHPPLARIFTALLPKMFGAHGSRKESMWDEGLAILMSRGEVGGTLALARAGTLPFFWLACWISFCAARWIAGGAAGVLAVLLVSMSPTVLAHAGLATTDIALTAGVLATVYCGARWLGEPGWARAVWFGVGVGSAVLAKFSALPFLPSIAVAAGVMWFAAERPGGRVLAGLVQERLLTGVAACAVAAVIIWAGYRFSFGTPPGWRFALPAPELFAGIDEVKHHDATGHLTYLLGRANTVGWWYFYAAALAVKTPIPLLLLGSSGLVVCCMPRFWGTRALLLPAVVTGVIGYSSFLSQIRIGTRHVLPATVALCIAGALGVVWGMRRWEPLRFAQYGLAVVVASVIAASMFAHPDYLAYFNLAAGDQPEAWLVDSDLDWGQDVKRLSARLRETGAQSVFFNQYAPGDLTKMYGMPPVRPLDPNGPQPGWNAVSLTPLKYGMFGNDRYVYDPGFLFWPERVSGTERVGRGLLLYYRPEK